jgi:prephenate dehydratase
MEIKIAIQGIKGSFHHQVAQEYFGQNVLVDECLSLMMNW